jgi:DNA double-strand break repair helicase HerA and related ATPase
MLAPLGLGICFRREIWRCFGTLAGGGRRGDSLAEAMAKSATRTIGSSVGRQLVRGVLGSLLGGKK